MPSSVGRRRPSNGKVYFIPAWREALKQVVNLLNRIGFLVRYTVHKKNIIPFRFTSIVLLTVS